ncbi:MAG: DUF2341 domain-containing protein [Candidatus Njordarchaeales archaeon]
MYPRILKILSILCLIALIISVPGIKQYSINCNIQASPTVMDSSWLDGESISVLLVRTSYLLPQKLLISKGTVISGSIYSLYTQSDSLLIKASNNEWLVYLEFSNFEGGELEVLAKIYINDSSTNTIYETTAFLSIHVYDSSTGLFFELGPADGRIYHLDPWLSTHDKKLIIKFTGLMTSSLPSGMYYYANISVARIKPDLKRTVVPSEYRYIDSQNVIHKVSITVDEPNMKIILENISIWWKFLYSEPKIKLNYTERSFVAKTSGVYTLFFVSHNRWQYPSYIQSQLILVDSRGRYLSLDYFRVFYRFIMQSYQENSSRPAFFRVLTVTNPYSFDLINYRLRIELNQSNFNFFSVRPDLLDMFFVKASEIPHYIDLWDGEKAIIYVKANITAGSNNVTMYYGARGLVTSQDPWAGNDFIIIDDFNYASELLSKNWTVLSGSWSTSSSQLYNTQQNDYATIRTKLRIPPYVSITFGTLELTPSSATSQYLGLHAVDLIVFGLNSSTYFVVEFRQASSSSSLYNIKLIEVVNGVRVLETQPITNQRDTTIFTTLTITAYIDFSQNLVNVTFRELGTSLTLSPSINLNTSGLGFVGIRSANGSIFLDRFTVKYLALLNVTLSLGEEEINPTGISQTIISDYERAYSPYITVPRDCLLNIVIQDPFNTTLLNKTLIPEDTIPIILQVYSFKIKNNRDDIFVHIKLSKSGTPFVWSEWLAPGEVAEYLLSGGEYSLELQYPSGETAFFDRLTVSDDVYFMINGTVLGDVIAQLTRVNETLVNQIYKIDIRLSNLNSTIQNQTVELSLHIENINTTISEFFTTIRNNLTAIESNISSILYNISNRIESVQSIIEFVNTTILNNLTEINSTITGVLINFRENVTILLTNISKIELNTTQNIFLVNSSIHRLLEILNSEIIGLNSSIDTIFLNLTNKLLAINSSIGRLYINISSQIITMNTTLSKFLVNILNSIEQVNATVLEAIYTLLQQLKITNTSIVSVIWNLTDEIIMIRNRLGNITLKLDDYIIMINTTLNNLIADIRTNTLLINSIIYTLNETVLVTLTDLQMNLTKIMWLTLDELRNITELLPILLNVFKLRLINYFTGEILPLNQFKIVVNSTLINDATILTIGDRLNVTVLDYWDRVLWSNITSERDIEVLLKIGRIIFINEREETIQILIAPANYSDPLSIILPPYASYSLLVYSESFYNITVVSGKRIISSGTYAFPQTNKEPVILLKITYEGTFMVESPNTVRIFIMSLVIGTVASTVSTILYRILSLRQTLVDSDKLVKKILKELEKEEE